MQLSTPEEAMVVAELSYQLQKFLYLIFLTCSSSAGQILSSDP